MCLGGVDWIEQEVRARAITPEEQLFCIFDLFDEWFHQPDFEGCSFVRVLLEMGPAHPIGQAGVSHLNDVRAFVQQLAEEAGLRDPAGFAWSWHLLMKGAGVQAVGGDRNAANPPGTGKHADPGSSAAQCPGSSASKHETSGASGGRLPAWGIAPIAALQVRYTQDRPVSLRRESLSAGRDSLNCPPHATGVVRIATSVRFVIVACPATASPWGSGVDRSIGRLRFSRGHLLR